MAKQEWVDLTETQVTKRLGRLLELAFVADAPVGIGGTAGALAALGDDGWAALQVEQKHTHPAENVLQYWPWLERNRRRLVLVHAIAPDARRREGPRTELTKWLGGLMERVHPGRFVYCRVELGSPDEEEQLAAVRAAIDELRAAPTERRPATGV